MMPIGDDNSDRTITPFVNYILLAANVLVFVFLQGMGSNERFTYAFSTVPREIVTGRDVDTPVEIKDPVTGEVAGTVDLQPTPIPVYLTLLTSMFMHGGFMHLFGNMLFLWVFGDNIENLLGHIRYGVFYLLCGFAAALGQILMGPDSVIPMLGASGAISGVLGGYLISFPKRRVRAIVFNFLTEVPAYVALGIWIVYQIVLGFFTPAGTGGVAYAAHIGGFAAGLALVKLFAIGRR